MNLADLLRSPLALFASAKDKAGPLTLTGTASVELCAEAGEGEEPRSPRFSMHAYDGSAMQTASFFSPVVVDLQGARARSKVKAFLDHDKTKPIGHADKVTIDASGIRIAGPVSAVGPHVDQVVASARNGFEWESSIGANVIRREFVEAGKTVTVNGRTFTGPLIVARETELFEASFTAIGAASESTASIAAGKEISTMTFEQWLEANGFDPKAVTDSQKAVLRATFEAGQADDGEEAETETPPTVKAAAPATMPKPKPKPAAPAGPADNGGSAGVVGDIRAEYARIGAVQSICARYQQPRITVGDQEVDLQAHAISEGWDADKTELHAMRASRPQAPFGNVGSRSGAPDNAQVIEAAMCLAAGCSEKFLSARFNEKVLNAAMERRYQGFGIQQLIYASVAANGGHVTPGRMDGDTIRAALMTDPGLTGVLTASGGFSSISLSGILGNVANKAMVERFEMLSSVVGEVANETDTRDFKQFTRYRLDGSGTFGQVGPDGELKHIQLQESSYANQLKTYGGMIALTRQMIINDDLGAFMQIPLIFVEMALHAREQSVFNAILGNAGSFFSTGNGNYFEGAATNLQLSSLDTAVRLFREQTNAGGQFVMIPPSKLLVPPALEGTAKSLYESTELGAGSGDPVTNRHKGSFRPVVSPYLGVAGGHASGSNTAWYMLAEPRTGHAIVQIGYLQGQRRPTLESAQANFNVLGVQWRSYWDFGVALHEKRAGVKSKGAA